MPVCFTLVSRDERRKSEVNFEADYGNLTNIFSVTNQLKSVVSTLSHAATGGRAPQGGHSIVKNTEGAGSIVWGLGSW